MGGSLSLVVAETSMIGEAVLIMAIHCFAVKIASFWQHLILFHPFSVVNLASFWQRNLFSTPSCCQNSIILATQPFLLYLPVVKIASFWQRNMSSNTVQLSIWHHFGNGICRFTILLARKNR